MMLDLCLNIGIQTIKKQFRANVLNSGGGFESVNQ